MPLPSSLPATLQEEFARNSKNLARGMVRTGIRSSLTVTLTNGSIENDPRHEGQRRGHGCDPHSRVQGPPESCWQEEACCEESEVQEEGLMPRHEGRQKSSVPSAGGRRYRRVAIHGLWRSPDGDSTRSVGTHGMGNVDSSKHRGVQCSVCSWRFYGLLLWSVGGLLPASR